MGNRRQAPVIWPRGLAQSRDSSGELALRTETRISSLLVFVRIGTSMFAYFPLFTWHSLAHPWLAAIMAVAASGEALWFARRVRSKGDLRDSTLVTVDVVFCLLLMAAGAVSAHPGQRNVVATELIPIELACAAMVGAALEFGAVQVCAVLALMCGWVFAVLPDVRLKLFSDLLGFVLWYVIGSLSMREFRALARSADAANAEAAQSQRSAAAQALEAEQARQSERFFRAQDRVHFEVHGHLLPVVERVIAGEQLNSGLLRDARLAARRARRLIEDPRSANDPVGAAGFSELIDETCDTQAGTLILESVSVITADPPADLAQALCAATAEALRNVVHHAGPRCHVHLFIESTATRGEIIIRDRGPGFDPTAVIPGGGFTGTFAALSRYDAAWSVDSRPGAGTTVTITWQPAATPRPEPRPTPEDADAR